MPDFVNNQCQFCKYAMPDFVNDRSHSDSWTITIKGQITVSSDVVGCCQKCELIVAEWNEKKKNYEDNFSSLRKFHSHFHQWNMI